MNRRSPQKTARAKTRRGSSRRATFCAAVDLGATSGRVIVGTWTGARLELEEVHRFTNQFRPLGENDYWDVPYLWGEIRAGLIKARQRFPRLASVGVDSWGVDHVLVNAGGRPVFPVHAYRDKRTLKISEAFERDGFENIYAITGLPNYPYNSSLQLKETLRACPPMADAAARCLFIPDYLNFLLSGKMENEISISSHSQLIDARGTDWSPEALAYFGIPRHWFSKPALAGQVLGPVRNFPELKGVRSALVPGHDTACAFAAMPAAADGSDLYLSSGTWSLLGFESDSPVLGAEARRNKVSNERSGDGRYRPLRACLGLWLLEQLLPSFATRPTTPAAWQKLIAAAARAPRPRQLLDVNDTSLFNPTSMRAAIDAQLKKNKARPPRDLAAYVRLICDSLGKGHADAVRTFEKLSGRKFNRILIVGGGSKNALLCQATADASGLPVASYNLEGSAVGNIANQLIALRVVKSLADFRARFAAQLKATVYRPRMGEDIRR